MEGVKGCHYSIDGLQCEHPFAHSGDHLVTVGDREVKWQYGDSERTEDLVRGYSPCYAAITLGGEPLTCMKEIDHEGVHEDDNGYTFSDDDIQATLNVQAEPESAPLHATPATSPVVAAALLARQDQEPSLVAVTRLGGGVDRFEVIGWHVHEGALYVITHEDDIVYAAGQWVGVRAQARS